MSTQLAQAQTLLEDRSGDRVAAFSVVPQNATKATIPSTANDHQPEDTTPRPRRSRFLLF